MGNKCCGDASNADVVKPTSQMLDEVKNGRRGADLASKGELAETANFEGALSLISTNAPSPTSAGGMCTLGSGLSSKDDDDKPFPVVDKTVSPIDITPKASEANVVPRPSAANASPPKLPSSDRKSKSMISPRPRSNAKPKFRSEESPTQVEIFPQGLVDEFPDPPFSADLLEIDPAAKWVDLVDGTRYRGGWNATETVQEGVGELMCPDGSQYLGEFKRGVAHGFGVFTTAEGSIYQGQFANGKASGYGVYTFKDGTKYMGEFIDDKPHGRGKEVSTDGVTYVGDFVANVKQGEGILTSPSGDEYKGHFVSGEIRGFGEYRWADGRHYMGHWDRNLQEGKGVFDWPDGKRYEGEYHQGQMHGRGTLNWPDGRKYVGQWANGQLDGEGIYWASANKWRMGLFRRGRVVRFFDEQWNEGPVDEHLQRRQVLQGIRNFSNEIR